MTTGNVGEPSDDPTAPAGASSRMPADYYSTPPSQSKPLPRWIPYGCGTASIAFVLLLFGAALLLTGPRLAGALDFVIGMSLGEMRPMYAKDVTAQEKEQLEAAISTMREGLRSGRIGTAKVQPFLKVVQTSIEDQSVTRPEVEQMSKAARQAAQ